MLGNWTSVRDLRPLPKQSFRGWWRERAKKMDSKGVL
jgi:L-lactate dehydrogenase complex protein LldF